MCTKVGGSKYNLSKSVSLTLAALPLLGAAAQIMQAIWCYTLVRKAPELAQRSQGSYKVVGETVVKAAVFARRKKAGVRALSLPSSLPAFNGSQTITSVVLFSLFPPFRLS